MATRRSKPAAKRAARHPLAGKTVRACFDQGGISVGLDVPAEQLEASLVALVRIVRRAAKTADAVPELDVVPGNTVATFISDEDGYYGREAKRPIGF